MTNEIPQGIKGITDRQKRPPRIGKVRLGVLMPNRDPKRAPVPRATDHFVFDDDFKPAALAALGAEPKVIEVVFPSNDLQAVAANNYKFYGSRGLKCVGNGVEARALVKVSEMEAWNTQRADGQSGELRREAPPEAVWLSGRDDSASDRQIIPCFGMGTDGEGACPMYDRPQGCRPVMHLQFLIPSMPGFGVWQCDTGSEMSILSILGFLEHLASLTGGQIAAIPLNLSLVAKDVTPDGHKKTVYILELSFGGTMGELHGLRDGGLMNAILPPPAEADRPSLELTAGEAPEEFEQQDPTVHEDGEADLAHSDTIGLPPEGFENAQDFFQWCWNHLEVTSAQALERLELGDFAALRDRFDGDITAAGAELLRRVQGDRVMARFDDAPRLGDEKVRPSDKGAEQSTLSTE